MPSKSEAGPVVSMEAMACNLPILSSNVGRVAELLQEENIDCIVDKNNIYRMQIYLEEFLSGENKISSLDRKDAMKYFDWRNVSKEFIKIYDELVNQMK